MKIETPTVEKAKMAYYTIKERLAAVELGKKLQFNLIEFSDIIGPDSYQSWDIIYKYYGSNIAEIKLRKHFSTDFKDWYMEKTKYDELMKLKQIKLEGALVKKAKYILFLFDGTYIFDMDDINPDTYYMRELREKTVNGSYKTVPKLIYDLDLTKAEKVDYILNFDMNSVEARNCFKIQFPHNINDILNCENYDN